MRRGSLGSQPCSTLQWRPLRNFGRPLRPPQYEVNTGVSPVMTRACCSPHKRAALIDFYSSKSRIRVEVSDALEAASCGPPRWTVFSGVTDSAFFGSQGGQCLEGSDLLLSRSTERSTR